MENKDKIALVRALEAQRLRESQRQFYTLFPDTGDRGRKLYPKHLEFFKAGHEYRERCFMAANRVGKTVAGAYEVTCHATGNYPDWWEGKRFTRPTRSWVAGKTNENTRDIVQNKLCGDVIYSGSGVRKTTKGTGIIPGTLIGDMTWKAGVIDLIDTLRVKHTTGDWSTIGFKSYQQGRGSFEGTEQDVIWLDEEPPEDVYGECLIRTATTNGVVMLTFTPLEGMSSVVLSFLPKGLKPD